MKRILLMMVAVLVAAGFAMSAMAQQDEVEVQEKTLQRDDTTFTRTRVKDTKSGATVEKKTAVSPSSVRTEDKVSGKNVKMEMKRKDTGEEVTGQTKVKVKKGALKKLSVDYSYYMEGNNYVIEYNVKDKVDPDLLKELNLTPDEQKAIKSGHHKIISTSPYTAGDVKNDFRSIILMDIKEAATKSKKRS